MRAEKRTSSPITATALRSVTGSQNGSPVQTHSYLHILSPVHILIFILDELQTQEHWYGLLFLNDLIIIKSLVCIEM